MLYDKLPIGYSSKLHSFLKESFQLVGSANNKQFSMITEEKKVLIGKMRFL